MIFRIFHLRKTVYPCVSIWSEVETHSLMHHDRFSYQNVNINKMGDKKNVLGCGLLIRACTVASKFIFHWLFKHELEGHEQITNHENQQFHQIIPRGKK